MRAARRVVVAAAFLCSGWLLGLAASLAFSTESLAASRVPTPRCTSTGLGVVTNLSGANVASVTVSGIPSACGNATIQVAVNNGSASSSGSGTVPTGGGSVTVTLGSTVASTASAEIDLVVTGP